MTKLGVIGRPVILVKHGIWIPSELVARLKISQEGRNASHDTDL